MTWEEAKLEAEEIMRNLRTQYQPFDVRLVLRALSRQHHKEKPMEKQTAMVIVSEVPFTVQASGSFGGGYTKPSSKESLVKDAAAALGYELYGRRDVKFIGPDWVRDALKKQGFEKI